MSRHLMVATLAAGAVALAGCTSTSLGGSDDADDIRLSLQTLRRAGVSETELSVARGAPALGACSADDVSTLPVLAQWDAFVLGDLGARECAVRALEGASDLSSTPSYLAVRRDVMRLHGFYNRRAQRQQAFMDFGSGVSIIGAAGAFEGGISDSTRRAWAIAAFVPVVFSQFNAYEPTRELFHGGALALQLITLRYDRYNRALGLLEGVGRTVDCAPYAEALATIQRWSRTDASAETRAYDPDRLLLAEARRLNSACLDLKRRAEELGFATSYAAHLRPYLAAEYAADVLQLDHAIVGKDHELRYSPSETLSALVASPLRAADMLLTGENTKAAIDSLKTQIAFSGLNRNLATIGLPPLPAAAPPIAPLSESALSLGRPEAPDEVNTQVTTLRALAEGLRVRHARQTFELRLAGELSGAASADYLTFAYDAATTTTTVSIGARPRTTALAPGDTAGGLPPGQ